MHVPLSCAHPLGVDAGYLKKKCSFERGSAYFRETVKDHLVL